MLATQSDADLVELIATMEGQPGWGTTGTLSMSGHKVFVKVIPLTDLEHANVGSTRNLYDLPAFYQYGVGSAGFGAAREVAAHIKTTRWVLDGAMENFPILYHHRRLPIPAKMRKRNPEQLERYVASWDGSPAIRAYMEARQNSTHSVALFIEHIPHVLQHWLPAHQDRVQWVVEQGIKITEFLRMNNVAHFDCNPSNVLTDGVRLYFSDFGLFLDAEYDLSESERDFLRRHRFLDMAEFVASLSWPLPNQEIEYTTEFRRALSPYAPIAAEMSQLFERLHTGPKTIGGYDDERIEALFRKVRTSSAESP